MWRMKRRMGLAALVVLMLALSGCGVSPIGGSGVRFGHQIVDWVDFVRFDGITYLANTDRGSRALVTADLGPIYATVRNMLSGNVNDPGYRSRDGDAAFLPPGTAVYEVKGYASSFRLAAQHAGHIALYEADTNPRAKTGADLLDIGGKVRTIAVISDQDGMTQLGEIDGAAAVQSLVAMALRAPVNQSQQPTDSTRYFIAFNLLDGTRVLRAYWPESNLMQRGILLPRAFAAAIRQSIGP